MDLKIKCEVVDRTRLAQDSQMEGSNGHGIEPWCSIQGGDLLNSSAKIIF
jgi:hypothetical protein